MRSNIKRVVLKRSQLEQYKRKSLVGHWVLVTESFEDLQKENDKSSKHRLLHKTKLWSYISHLLHENVLGLDTDNKVMDGSSDLIYHTGINCDYFAVPCCLSISLPCGYAAVKFFGHVPFPPKFEMTDSAIARFHQIEKGSIPVSANLPAMDRGCSDESSISTRFTTGNVTVRPGSAEGFLDISGGGYLHVEGERFDGGGPFDRVSTVNADDNLLRLESFHTFKSVRRLSLRRNRLKSVRPIDGDLAETLIRLDVSENQLNPDDIYRLSMSKLEELYMLANNLTVIPESITNCHCFLSLKLLDLSDNYLSSPRTLYMLSTLHNLQELIMSNNRISYIPYLIAKQEADNSNGDNKTEAYQDEEDIENNKSDDAKKIIYQVHHIPFVSLNTINLSNNLIAHNSSVIPLVCWPSLKNVILTANNISLKKNLIEFKNLSSTLSVFNIKIKR